MTRHALTLIPVVLAGALLVATPGFGQISCTREGLPRAADLYIAAQTRGDTSGMPLAMGLGYMENAAPADISNGFIKTAMKIDQRSLLDTATDVAAAPPELPDGARAAASAARRRRTRSGSSFYSQRP